MKFIKTPIKGMCDRLPSEMRLREHILCMIKNTYAKYGFMQIETPAMEHIENLTSKQGGDNEKLIFKIMKRGQDFSNAIESGKLELADGGLRYDLTVPLARYYANNREKVPTPFKSLQIGNVWRADKPQKGRFRQFTQCDIDILGEDSNLAEIELIAATSNMLSAIFHEVGISQFYIRINDREILTAVALASGFAESDVPSILVSLDKYDKIGIEGIRTELLANGYDISVVEKYLNNYKEGFAKNCREFCDIIDKELLGEDIIANIEEIISCVKTMISDEVKIIFDPTLVRGMGYYTGPIFEIGIEGYNFSIAGGGRYDKMIGKFSGQDVCACGFSIGFERIISIINDKLQNEYSIGNDNIVFLIHKDVEVEKKLQVLEKASILRKEGKIVVVQQMKKNLKIQIEKLENEGYKNFEKIYND